MELIYWYTAMILLGLLSSIPCFFLDLKSYKKAHQIIFFIIITITIVEFFGRYLGQQGITNHWIYNIGFLYGETALILFYLSVIIEHKLSKKILHYTAVTFIGWGIITSLFISPITQFHNYNYTLAGILIILGCFTFFYHLVTKETYTHMQLWKVPDFWVVSFILLFYSASLLFFSFLFHVLTLESSMVQFLNFFVKILSGTMYLSMGLLYYLALLKNENRLDATVDLKYSNSRKLSM
ncbi:MAG: hypothetical protein ACXIUD_17020 [Mongoliitalea sp.]